MKQQRMNREISGQAFQQEVIRNPKIALVQFKTEWSGACQIIAPIYEELAKSYKGMVNFYSIDVEKEQELEDEYGIVELPTILFFKDGNVIDHVIGMAPRNILIHKIETALEPRSN